MFSPITMSEEERLDLIKNSFSKKGLIKYAKKIDSLEEFHTFLTQMRNGVEAQMQIYVLENYKKVPIETWNESTFEIVHHLGKDKLLFGKRDKFKTGFTKHAGPLREWAEKRYNKSIKITEIDFTLDHFDGDFSVKFNGDKWSFLWGDDILKYYYVVKRFLEV